MEDKKNPAESPNPGEAAMTPEQKLATDRQNTAMKVMKCLGGMRDTTDMEGPYNAFREEAKVEFEKLMKL